jgi:hypothetical protein
MHGTKLAARPTYRYKNSSVVVREDGDVTSASYRRVRITSEIAVLRQ